MSPRRLPERIESDHVFVRRWTRTDADAMENVITASLEHLRPWMAWARREPLSIEARLRLFEKWDRYWASGNGAVYAIEVAGEIVGGCSLHRRVGPGGLDLGYWLGRDGTGRGIASHATAALTDAAFTVDDVDFVQVSHTRANVSSGAVAQRLGFVDVTGEQEDAITIWRRTRDHHRPGSTYFLM